jgi:magnesium chelatase family protein
MSLPTIVYSRVSHGIRAPLVVVEAHLSGGVPRFSIVGLPEAAVKESKDRVRSALLSTHFEFPPGRITVNLAPADLPKDGGRFDLPIALGILAASGQIPHSALNMFEFAGELGLSGALRSIQGALPFALATCDSNRTLILPFENAHEASLAKNLHLLPAKHLLEVCAHLSGQRSLSTYHHAAVENEPQEYSLDLSDIHGQASAKRALEIAAAGQHSLLMTGPPGTGKTMLASRLSTILPAMLEREALESAAVLSIAGKVVDEGNFRRRPFRAPHHTASSVALVGGGSPPKPGEISLAHQGVLFLDELPEFNRNVLEALREPLESGHITISRACHQAQFPANFQLVAAMNPCPCGYLGDSNGRCRCTADQVQRYKGRISGPLLDRIDMHIQVLAPDKNLFFTQAPACESSADVQSRVTDARAIQVARHGKANAHLAGKELLHACMIAEHDQILLKDAMEKFGLSGRAYHRVLKVARTIADLAGSEHIQTAHLTESLSYRMVMKRPF